MRIYILRHAKADKTSPTGRDEDRPLVQRGRAQALFLAERFGARQKPFDVPPVRVIASKAVRARETAGLIAGALGLTIAYEPALLPDTGVGRAFAAIESLAHAPEPAPALIVGHNPQLEGLLRALVGGAAPDHLRTGECAAIELSASGALSGRLLGLVRSHSE